MSDQSDVVHIADEVAHALETGLSVVALETAVLTHGLPEPRNLEAMARMDAAVRRAGAIPAICLVEGGRLLIGATLMEAECAARDPKREKASVRDLGSAIARGIPAGLTVSATLFTAELAGIRSFATGGIGGVHQPYALVDVSADLPQLARSPVVVVCSGAKSVLDIPRTLEYLETLGVPVVGYRTSAFPAFYLRSSGEQVPCVQSTSEVARLARVQRELGLRTALVVGNPIRAEAALPEADWNAWLNEALATAEAEGVRGKTVTPYLLDRVAALSGGRTVEANLALLEDNARLAAEIACALV